MAIWLVVVAFIGFLVIRPIVVRVSLGMPVLPTIPVLGGLRIPLPRGYSLGQSTTSYPVLLDSSNWDMMNNHHGDDEATATFLSVDGYRVHDDLLIGHVTEQRERGFVGPPPSSFYFILRFSTGTLEKDLSRKRWLARLRSLGVKSEPRLHRPDKMDDLRGYNRP